MAQSAAQKANAAAAKQLLEKAAKLPEGPDQEALLDLAAQHEEVAQRDSQD